MRIRLNVDNLLFEIDSRDPELLAKWLLEKFSTIPFYQHTWVRIETYPSFAFEQGYDENRPAADWIADSRYLQWYDNILSPMELWERMGKTLRDAGQNTEAKDR